MHIRYKVGAGGDFAVYGNLYVPLTQQHTTPSKNIIGKSYSPFVPQHRRFPKRDCGNCELFGEPGLLSSFSRPWA